MKLSAVLCLASCLASSSVASLIPEKAARSLEERATDRTWQQSVEYGKQILEATKAKTDAGATIKGKSVVSTYNAITDLATNGWQKSGSDLCLAQICDLFDDNVYVALGVKKAEDEGIQYKNGGNDKYVKVCRKISLPILRFCKLSLPTTSPNTPGLSSWSANAPCLLNRRVLLWMQASMSLQVFS